LLRTLPIGGDPTKIAWALYDQFGNRIVASDGATGGLALPWIPIPLYPLFTGGAGVVAYSTVSTSSVTSETPLWEGRIDKLLAPYIQITGIWGQASGSNTATYRLKVGGTQVGTWSPGGLVLATQGPYAMPAGMLNQEEVQVQLTVQATGTGLVAVQPFSCTQRQT
jgi:hypothetical protein